MREFKLPDVGEGVAEGEIVRWLVAEGDAVEEDQPVAEVETDKALVEVPSPVDGTVREIRAAEGEVVPVGTVIIVFDEAGEGGGGTGEAIGTDDGDAEEADETTDATPEGSGAEIDGRAPAGVDPDASTEPRRGGHAFAPPHVRRLARELGVEVSAVSGSGPGGRVTEQDVRAAAGGERDAAGVGGEPAAVDSTGSGDGQASVDETAASSQAAAAVSEGTRPSGGATAGRDRTLAAPATRRVARELDVDLDAVPAVEERNGEAFVTEAAVREYADAQQAAQATDADAVSAGGAKAGARERGVPDVDGQDERVPYRGVRRTIGERMTESKFTAPHVTHHDTAVVEELVEARARLKPRAEERGVRLTYFPFVAKAVVAALQAFPYMNATLDEEAEEIVLRGEYHLGVAVATDHGLMVPVVENVDEKGLFDIAGEVSELAEKARERTISPEELRGSTFSITNFGAIGGEYATPIINYPEVAILGLGTIEERAVVEKGEVVPRHTLPLSLSIDHRVVDGAVAAEFANTMMDYLNEPLLLLE